MGYRVPHRARDGCCAIPCLRLRRLPRARVSSLCQAPQRASPMLGWHGSAQSVPSTQDLRHSGERHHPPALGCTGVSSHAASPTFATQVLVRHGETTWDSEGKFTGWADPHLSEAGKSQVSSAASPRICARASALCGGMHALQSRPAHPEPRPLRVASAIFAYRADDKISLRRSCRVCSCMLVAGGRGRTCTAGERVHV